LVALVVCRLTPVATFCSYHFTTDVLTTVAVTRHG